MHATTLLVMSALLLAATALGTALGLKDCPASKSAPGLSACPLNATCCTEQYFQRSGCVFAGTTSCCSPGPGSPVSATLPNCLIIGDSVSEQYAPMVARLLNATCKVQHSPSVGGGSANNAATGLHNLESCRWLRTAQRPDLHVNWDIVMFNFGLHDMQKADPAQPQLLDLYQSQMDNITQILLASGAKHVLYAMTTPFEADAAEGCGPYCSPGPTKSSRLGAPPPYPQPKNGGNGRFGPPIYKAGAEGCGVPNATAKAHSTDPSAVGCGPPSHAVNKLNARAAEVMAHHGVPTLDLNSVVHTHCGARYTNCSLCDDETKYMGVRCGYHYSSAGVDVLANAVADKFKQLLSTV